MLSSTAKHGLSAKSLIVEREKLSSDLRRVVSLKGQYELAQEVRQIFQNTGKVSRAHIIRVDRKLANDCLRQFDAWSKVVEAAGIDPALISKSRSWSKEKIVAKLRELHGNGEALFPVKAFRMRHPALHSACNRYLGSVGKAIKVAGIEPTRLPSQHLPPEDVIAAIRAARTVRNIHKGKKAAVSRSAKLFWGSLRDAVSLAGRDPSEFFKEGL